MEAEALKQRREEELDAVSCTTCGSAWFEQAKYFKLKADHTVIAGQEVPTVEPGLPAYILLRCVRCTNLLQPQIMGNSFGHDIATKSYNNFLDTAEGKNDSRNDFVETDTRVMMLESKLRKLEEKLDALQGKG